MRRRFLGSLVLCLAALTASPVAQAQDQTAAQREANVHFQRAVQLYSEADYRAALVEFKRAYEIAPHVTVLYNLGNTYYQLQNYAAALDAFEKFLAQGGTAHRQEVENAISVLKTRVGRVDISTPSPGWDVTIDDEAIGKTPLSAPVGVSIGRRKITATKQGEMPVTKYVEVAAGETQAVSLAGAAQATPASPPPDHVTPPPPADQGGGNGLILAGWIASCVLATGAVVTGILATSSASKLKDARNAYPGNKSDIDSKASTTTALAVTTDVLAATALIVGGVTLYFTLSKPSSTTTARVGVSGSRLMLEGTF